MNFKFVSGTIFKNMFPTRNLTNFLIKTHFTHVLTQLHAFVLPYYLIAISIFC